MQRINDIIVGTDYNDILYSHYDFGFTEMYGGDGNDTYTIKNFKNTATNIIDTAGNDTLLLQNTNGNDLLFLFDVDAEKFYIPDPELFIVKKDDAYSIMNQLANYYNNFVNNGDYLKYIPQSGLVVINGVLDYDRIMKKSYLDEIEYKVDYRYNSVENIYTQSSSGAKYSFDIDKYVETVTPEVRKFLKANKQECAMDIILSGSKAQREKLIEIYKNTPLNYIVTGSSNADKISGSLGDDSIKGDAGNDTIKGGAGKDQIWGGNGNDSIEGNSENDTIKGDAGNDTIKGGTGNDQIWGGNGNDSLEGNSGNDTIKGDAGNDTIKAGSGDDKIYGGKGNDKIYTESGKNVVFFNDGDGSDTLYKGTGSDTLRFDNYANLTKLTEGIKFTKTGNDLKINYTSKDSVLIKDYFKNGSTVKKIASKDNKSTTIETLLSEKTLAISGSNVTGTKYKDVINGTGDSDTLKGADGNDKIYGKDGDDKLYGGNDNDQMWGGKGKDTLEGGSGNDTLKGEDGNDSIKGGSGNDKIYGGKGNDTINAGTDKNVIFFANNDGKDTIIGGKGHDTLEFTDEKINNIKAKYSGNDAILTYTGGTITLKDYVKGAHSAEYVKAGDTKKSVNDILPYYNIKNDGSNYTGTKIKDSVSSTIENAVIKTYEGNDKIELSKGKNKVWAGKGDDTITNLGSGKNVYHFSTGDGKDKIIIKGDYNGSDLFVFDSSQSIDDIKIKRSGNNITISYNKNKDSVTLDLSKVTNSETKPTGYVQVGGKKYSILGNGNGLSADTIICTEGDDNLIHAGNMPKNIITGSGNDVLDFSLYSQYELLPYFNVKSDGTLADNTMHIKCATDDSGYVFYGDFDVVDYFSKQGSTMLKNTANTALDDSNIDSVKAAVAGWLSENNYADVSTAINGENGYDNLVALMGAEYFGQLSWNDVVA